MDENRLEMFVRTDFLTWSTQYDTENQKMSLQKSIRLRNRENS